MAGRVAAIGRTTTSLDISRTLLQPGLPVVPDLAFVPLDWITTELLPTTMRHRLGLADLSTAQLAAVRSAQVMSRVTLPLLPPQLSVSPFVARALSGAH